MAIGKITSKSLAADAVTSANLAPGAVTISDIPDSEITADKLHTTLDLSTKTLTLTQASVTAHQAALSITQSQISDLSTTSDLAEGTNLYYTDARADARISAATTTDLTEGTNLYYTDARADARVALLVDSAPGTLDTLNELAAALGDDPNFATTTANNIAAKLPLAGGTLTGNVGVGTTNGNPTGNHEPGCLIAEYGQINIHRDGGNPLRVGSSVNGNLTEYYTQGVLVGSVFSSGGIQMGIGDGDTALLFADNIDAILPWSTSNVQKDNTIDLGRTATRFKDLHLSGNIYVGGSSVIDSNRRILAADGAENVPYITFAADTNTGLYRPGTDTLGFSTAGSERMRINSLGNVGIGIAAMEGSAAAIKVEVESGSNYRPMRLRFIDDNNGSTNNPLAFEYKAGLEIENIYSGAAPSANGTKIAKLSLTTVTSSGYGATGSIFVTTNAGTGYNAGELAFAVGHNSSGLETEAMRINKDGEVGIGTTGPEVKLEVNGGADDSVVFGGRSDGGNGNNRRFNLIAYADGGGANYGGGLKIQTRDSVNVFHDRITVRSNGYVGIGNNDAAYHIDARGGTSTAFGMRVKTGDNGYDGLIVSNSAVLKCYPAAGQSVSLQAYNSSGSAKTGVKVTGASTPAGDISTEIESVTELLGHNVYDNGSYGTSNDQYVDLEDWSPTDFRILEIFGTANPNSGGSGAYADPVHMYVYNGTGWNGAEVTYYVYGKSVAPLARDMFGSGSGSSANVAEVWWYNSSTTAQQDAATSGTASGYHLRLKFPNTNTNNTMVSLKVIKRA